MVKKIRRKTSEHGTQSKAKLKQVHISLKQVVANEKSLPIVTGNIIMHGVHGMVRDTTLYHCFLTQAPYWTIT